MDANEKGILIYFPNAAVEDTKIFIPVESYAQVSFTGKLIGTREDPTVKKMAYELSIWGKPLGGKPLGGKPLGGKPLGTSNPSADKRALDARPEYSADNDRFVEVMRNAMDPGLDRGHKIDIYMGNELSFEYEFSQLGWGICNDPTKNKLYIEFLEA